MISMILNSDRSEKVSYTCGDYPIYVRRGLLSLYPGFTAPPHWHDDIELIAVYEGRMQYNVNGDVVTLNAGEGILVNSRQLHFGFSDLKKECSFVCILLHPMLLCTTSAFERDFVRPVIDSEVLPYVVLTEQTEFGKEALSLILQMEAAHGLKTAPLIVQSCFLKLWSALFDTVPQSEKPTYQSADIFAVKRMIGLIQTDYAENLSLSDIAAYGAVGQSKCCRLFKKYTSRTPNAYLLQYRLNKSTELLKNTDMSVTEIAHATGFCGSSYFAEAFKKQYNQTPSEYRKE